MPYVSATLGSVTTTIPPKVRGECPGVHTPFLEADGALLRIRTPGGMLSARGLQVAAGSGRTLEITSRANLQVRGLDPAAVPAVAAGLVAAGLALADPARDERRNVVASPTAGFDAAELVDTRPLVAAVAGLLAAEGGVRSPKFGVLVDGGGTVSVRGRRHDVCLGAVRVPGRPGVAFEVRLDEPLPLTGNAGPAVVVPEGRAQAAVEAALTLCPPGGRMADALATAGREALLHAVATRCGGRVSDGVVPPQPGRAPCDRGAGERPEAAATEAAIGVHGAAACGPWAGTVWCGAAPLLGRLSAEAALGLAALAGEFGDGEIRLTPWRGVILPGVAPAAAADLILALARLGLSADPADPRHQVVACAGSTGCHAGLTDTQADAARLVDQLRTSPPGPAQTVHLSGCEKGCASRGQADLTVVGAPGGTYELYRRDPAAGGFGRRRATGLPPDAALAAAAAGNSVR